MPTAPTPSSPRTQCTDQDRKRSLTCAQRERDGRRGGRRKSGALQLQRELCACVRHAQSSLFRREEARQSAAAPRHPLALRCVREDSETIGCVAVVKSTVVEVEFECNISAYAMQSTWTVKSTTTHDPSKSRDPDGCWGRYSVRPRFTQGGKSSR